MELIITEVTEMSGSMYCVGGWNAERQSMVRPLPGGKHWRKELITQHNIAPGARIACEVSGRYQSEYPHQTEDTKISRASIKNLNKGFSDWLGSGAPQQATTLAAIFGGHMVLGPKFRGYYKCSVENGAECRSLFGLRVGAEGIEFFEDQYGDNPKKLRARVSDGAGGYDLPVTCASFREKWRIDGLQSLQALFPRTGALHLRIGLARPWDAQPNRCSMQLNGVLF